MSVNSITTNSSPTTSSTATGAAPQAVAAPRVIEIAGEPKLSAMFAKAVATSKARHGKTLPNVEVVRRDVPIDVPKLADYNRVCGFRLSNTVPSTYLHVLVFPLQVALMSDKEFPFPLMGSVHLENTIRQLRSVTVDEVLTLTARVENLRPHFRGAQADLVGEVRAGDELVWQGRSTYLFRGHRVDGPTPERSEEPDAVDGFGALRRLPGDLGRRYAAVSGDANPIHTSKLGAKALGFPTTIAHGMWTKAHVLALNEAVLPNAYEVSVSFRKPVLIPSSVKFVSQTHDGGVDVAVRNAKKGTEHLRGTIRPL